MMILAVYNHCGIISAGKESKSIEIEGEKIEYMHGSYLHYSRFLMHVGIIIDNFRQSNLRPQEGLFRLLMKVTTVPL